MALKKRVSKKKAKKRRAVKRSSQKLLDMLVVSSRSKEALKGKEGFRVSSDSVDALNQYLHKLVESAQRRCKANGRKTIRPYDIF